MAVPFIHTNFSSGEVTPSLLGHVDLAQYGNGAFTMRNLFVSYRGGAYSRAGTAFVGYSKQTGRAYPPRLIPFQFSINQGLCLEFGNLYMRVIANGAYALEATVAVTGATQANPCVVTATGHGYSNGDWVYISGVGGMTQLNGRMFVVANKTTNTFELHDVYGNAVNSTAYGAYTSGGTVARVYTLVTPWGEADLPYLKYTQSADVMSMCCWNQDTGTSYPPYDLSRLSDIDWTLTEVSPSATIAAPATCSASASGSGSADFQYCVTAISASDGTESVASPIGDAPNSVNISATAGTITVNWAAVSGAKSYNIYKATPTTTGEIPSGANFGYINRAVGTQLIDTNDTPDFTQVPPTHQNPFAPGAISSVNVTSSGSGLSTVTWAVTTATGTGFNGYPVVVGGTLSAFVITNPGKKYAPGDSIAFNAAGYAAGAITFANNPTNTHTITLNGVLWSFVTAATGANQTVIQGTLAQTLTQLASDLSASANAALTVASYSYSATALLINYKTAGTAGNSYTLAASNETPSGPTLTGGSGTAGTNPVATLTIGPSTGTYPSVPSYYQQRRVYASSPNNPDTYWMSQPGAYTSFDTRLPTINSDAITGSPWSVQVNGIQFMVPMPGGLVVMNGLNLWQLTGTGGSSLNPQPITPSSQQAQPQTAIGCSATIPPIRIEYDIVYVQAKGSIVRDLNYVIYGNIYTGNDITVLSSHLFTGYTIKEWAWCEEPYKVIWAVRNDGILLSCTFLKSQNVSGWARHDTNGLYQSVCAVTEPPVDALYAAVQRFPGGVATYMVERMNDRLWNEAEDVWCVDCGLALAQPNPAATLSASSATGLGACVGVTGLVGGSGYAASTTAVVYDGAGNLGPGSGAVPSLTIAGGVITAITFAGGSQGSKYLDPMLVITDPTGSGSGASASIVLDNSATFTTSAGVFASGDVGKIIRMGGGIAKITAYTSTTQVTATISQPIAQIIPNSGGTPIPQTAGNWTMTAPVTTVTGLWHLAGMSVTGVADGQVIAPQTVSAAGTITLTTPASAVTVGLGYQAQLQTTYLDAGNPTVQGQRKKLGMVTARVEASRGMKCGANQPDGSMQSPPTLVTNWTGMQTVPDKGEAPYGNLQGSFVTPAVPLYTGDVRLPVPGGWEKQGQVCMQQDNPLPMNILALIPEVLGGDEPQMKAQPKNQRQPA